jgi:hypothetical protein
MDFMKPPHVKKFLSYLEQNLGLSFQNGTNTLWARLQDYRT